MRRTESTTGEDGNNGSRNGRGNKDDGIARSPASVVMVEVQVELLVVFRND